MTFGAAPKVSVLVPCFRSAGYVRRALDSVLAQTEPDWELVAVDNASDDGTYDVLKEYAARDPRVRAFRNGANVGPVRNWRRCAELARGRYAGLLFSDDWYETEFLAKGLSLLEADTGMGFAYTAVRVVNATVADGKNSERLAYQLGEGGPHSASEFLRSTYERRGAPVPVSPGCALMRRTDLGRWLARHFKNEDVFGYLRHGAGPDVAVYIQGCLEYPRFGHIAEPQVNFLDHGKNLTRRSDVALAYTTALRQIFEEERSRMPLDNQRVWAVFALRYRSTAYVRQALGNLSPRGWLMLCALAGSGALRKLVAALKS